MIYTLNINYINCQILNSKGKKSFLTADVFPSISSGRTVSYNLWLFITLNNVHSNST